LTGALEKASNQMNEKVEQIETKTRSLDERIAAESLKVSQFEERRTNNTEPLEEINKEPAGNFD
jgi:hypothetical protein